MTGPAAGNSIEAAAVTIDAVGTGSYKWVGKYRTGIADCRIAGLFDRTTGDETMTFTIREATDAAATGATPIASSAALTASHAGALASGTLPSGPTQVGFSTGAGGFIAVFFDMAGNTPSAAGVSVNVRMTSGAIQQSGR